MTDTQTWTDMLSVEDVAAEADVTDDVTVALQSQYAHAPRMKGVGKAVRDQVDATEDLNEVMKTIADPRTSAGAFLDWWGKRVGVDRFIRVSGKYERFDDDYFRFLLFYRAACNIADSTAATMNRMLSNLTDTTCFVADYQDMTINSIVIIGNISDLQASILSTYGLLNRPAGVLTNVLVIYPDELIFGFDGQELLPFDVGVFNPSRTIAIN